MKPMVPVGASRVTWALRYSGRSFVSSARPDQVDRSSAKRAGGTSCRSMASTASSCWRTTRAKSARLSA